MRISKFLLSGLLPVLCAAALAGCRSDGTDIDDVYTPVAHYERFPIEVKKGAVVMEIPANRRLSPANRDKLLRLAQMAHSNRASSVVVSRPAGSANGHAVASEAENILIRGGVPADSIVADTHGGRSSVVVSYTRSYAATAACGDWPEDLGYSPGNEPYANFGCAHQHNIAAMVANPEDLAIPETTTPPDPMRRGQVFTDYRAPRSTSTPADDQADATISQVAK
jgi:pilus assembly protein CpaD